MMNTLRITGLSPALLFCAFGCGAADKNPTAPSATGAAQTTDASGTGPGQGVHIRGNITMISRDQAGDVLGRVRIEGVLEEGTQFDKAIVSVRKETRILEQQQGRLRSVSFDDLKVGQKVEARFQGPVAESYPVQARAAEIVILK